MAIGRERRGLDVREVFRGELPAKLLVICAWCPTFDRNDPRNAFASHGLCESCARKMRAEMETAA